MSSRPPRRRVARAHRYIPVACLAVAALAGCGTVDPSADYARTSDLVSRATGSSSLWRPDAAVSEDEIRARAASAAADGLTLAEAVDVALMSNRAVRAGLYDVAIARADLVQAGLWSNPSFGISFRAATAGGPGTLDVSLLKSLTDLWHAPIRSREARAALDKTILGVAASIADTAAEVQRAFIEARTAHEQATLAVEACTLVDQLLTLARERAAAGAGTDLDVNSAAAEASDLKVLQLRARLDFEEARHALARLLASRIDLTTVELADLPRSRFDPGDVGELVTRARSRRLELLAADAAVDEARAALAREDADAWKVVDAGVDVERSDATEVGPAFEIEIPIFDQNQARIARATFVLRQAEERLAHGLDAAALEIQDGISRLRAARALRAHYESQVIADRSRGLDLARESFRAGKTAFLSVLEAERRLVAARAGLVDAARIEARSLVDLEHAIGEPVAARAESRP